MIQIPKLDIAAAQNTGKPGHMRGPSNADLIKEKAAKLAQERILR
jgi:hypothetical protein